MESRPSDVARKRITSEIGEGLAWVLRHPIVRVMTLNTAIFNVFAWFGIVLGILYMVRGLYLTPAQIGLVYALGGPGALVSSALIPRISRALGLGPSMVAGSVMMRLGLLATPAALGPTPLVIGELAAGSFLFGFGVTMSNVLQNSYRQAITPDHMQGRANAALLAIVYGVGPIGALLAGWLGSKIGLRPALWLGVAGSVIPLVILLLSPIPRLRSVEEATTA